jgi:hypothetical protein
MTKTIVVLGALGSVVLALPAAHAATPVPVAGEPGCRGHTVATLNHQSGSFGASGNPNASAGPGYFLGPDTSEAVEFFQELFCGTDELSSEEAN